MASKLLPYIETQEPIPTELMLAAFHKLGEGLGAEGRRKAANAILSGAGDYLPDTYYLTAFIKAELSNEDAKELISARKSYIERARHLLPTIFSQLGVRKEEQLYSVLRVIEDYCNDFPSIASSSHSKKLKNQTLEHLIKLKISLGELSNLLKKQIFQLDAEYEHHKTAIDRTKGTYAEYIGEDALNHLRSDLNDLDFVVNLTLYKDAIGEDTLSVGHNKAKTHIVECAYDLALWLEMPPFVTTPGSDFSLLSSLLYELASGEPDASLAGAINKFARSELRTKRDRTEAEIRWENTDEYMEAREADNFAHIREKMANLLKEHAFWMKMASSRAWDVESEAKINTRTEDVIGQLKRVQQLHGPFLVWAHHLSGQQLEDIEYARRGFEESEAKLLALQVEIGELRRQARRD